MNVILRHHSRSTYPSQTTRNVAEQIDAMYWASGEREGGGEEDDLVLLQGLSKEIDLRVDEYVTLHWDTCLRLIANDNCFPSAWQEYLPLI